MLRLVSTKLSHLEHYGKNLLAQTSVLFSSKNNNTPSITETSLKNKLKAQFPNASDIQIEDISGKAEYG